MLYCARYLFPLSIGRLVAHETYQFWLFSRHSRRASEPLVFPARTSAGDWLRGRLTNAYLECRTGSPPRANQNPGFNSCFKPRLGMGARQIIAAWKPSFAIIFILFYSKSIIGADDRWLYWHPTAPTQQLENAIFKLNIKGDHALERAILSSSLIALNRVSVRS